ncbi:pilus assembly protein [Acidithiobacillus sp. AMEEHan]|uniref:pilus assembly protein n=1 Tax=Acidithiobacillus sp. AMEEHan TaxID=2994951 RepID=UPI0027E3C71B|nr:pilus assembly protein [Acidithiobacillus sp. AMEEHan]
MLITGKPRERGQGMTEYLIVVALIAISSIVVFSRFGQTMRNQVAGLAHELVGTDSTKYGVKYAKQKADYAATNANKTKSMSDYTSANDLKKR